MASSIFYPYFYLSNDTLLRHQYLYTASLLRVHPCDRPPRDNKQVKRFVSELTQIGFLENGALEEFHAEIQRSFLTILERAFQLNRPLYLKMLGKYEKERASAKTFHLCRMKRWEELTRRLIELGIAASDNYEEWCFSTRMMVIIMTVYAALAQQQEKRIPRCTDSVEYEELAAFLECAPLDDGSDPALRRAILEFPYRVPKNLNEMQLDRLMTLRDAVAAIAGDFQQPIMDDAADLLRSSSLPELEERLQCIGERMQEITGKIADDFSSRNEAIETRYVQYRFYISADAPLAALPLERSFVQDGAAFSVFTLPANLAESRVVLSNPGSFVWCQETPTIARNSGGFLKRLFSFGKS